VGLGCQPSATVDADHDHEHGDAHELPETYAAALTEIKELRETIQNAFASGKAKEEGDAPLHEIGRLLNHLAHLAEDAGLSGDDVASVKAAADRVFGSYSNLDTVLHSAEPIPEGTYDRAAESIDSGIAELEAKLSLIDADTGHDEADHEGHEDHEHE
jgi:hypothetical protein